METQVYVIGVHGSQVVGISSLQDVCGLSRDDINHILNMWAEGKPAFVGEVEYREYTSAPQVLT